MAKTYLDSLTNRSASLDGSTSSDGLFSWAHKDGVNNTAATVSASGLAATANSTYGTSAETDTDSMYLEFVVSGITAGGAYWVDLSQSGTYPGGTGTEIAFFGGDVYAFDINSGAFDQLNSASHTFQAGTYRAEVSAGALTVTRNGGTILTATAVAATGAGKRKAAFGFDVGAGAATFTNFGYGDLGGGGGMVVNPISGRGGAAAIPLVS